MPRRPLPKARAIRPGIAGAFQPLHALRGRQGAPALDQPLTLLRRQLLETLERGVQPLALLR